MDGEKNLLEPVVRLGFKLSIEHNKPLIKLNTSKAGNFSCHIY
jgi:hypothetical protein